MVSSRVSRATNSTTNAPARRRPAGSPQQRRRVETGLGGEKLLRLRHAAQSVASDRNQTTSHLRANRDREARRNENILLDRAAHRQDSADLVHFRADDREVEAVLAADIAVKHIADMQRQINLGRRQIGFGTASIEFADAIAHPRRGGERLEAGLRVVLTSEDGEGPVADQLQYIAAM